MATATTVALFGESRLKVFTFLAFLVWLALSVILLFHPTGHLYEDEFPHFLIAKDADKKLSNFVYVWQRPGLSAIHVGPAQLGFRASRFTALALSVAAVFIIYRLGGKVDEKWGHMAVLFAILQPYFVLESFAVMTEVPCALVLGAALLLWMKKKPVAASLTMSLLPLFRPEGFLIIFVFAFFIVFSKIVKGKGLKILCLLCAGLGTAVWVGLGWFDTSDPFFIFNNNSYREAPHAIYGSGEIFGQLLCLLECAGPFIAVLIFAGTINMIYRRQFLFPALFLAFLAFHSILYYFGWWGEAKMPRYFVSILPVTAVLAVAGLRGILALPGLFKRNARRASAGNSVASQSAVFLLVLLIAIYFAGRVVGHIALDHRNAIYGPMRDSVTWLMDYSEKNGVPGVVAEHPYYKVYLQNRIKVTDYKDLSADKLEEGSVVLWDSIYASQVDAEKHSQSSLENSGKFERAADFASDPDRFRVKAYVRKKNPPAPDSTP